MSYDGEAIGWKSPIAGPVHPSLVSLGEPSGLGWLDGFDEFIVRCGLESNGAPDFDANHKLQNVQEHCEEWYNWYNQCPSRNDHIDA